MQQTTKHIERHLQHLARLIPRRAILAGGALRAAFDGTTPGDIDFFFRHRWDYRYACLSFWLLSLFGLYAPLSAPNGTRRFRNKVTGEIINLVGFVFGTPNAHMERFDFRCCKMAMTFSRRSGLTFYALPGAINDALNKHLVVVNNNGTRRTVKRIQRYIRDYGYTLMPACGLSASEDVEAPPESPEQDAYAADCPAVLARWVESRIPCSTPRNGYDA
ncbi:MAG: hypothetical protein Q4B94_00335 [Pseudomonadota bacterium]|nr:hypothetical protein [Pseudomonadota bacterium]